MVHHQVPSSDGSAEEASTTVAGAKWRGEDADALMQPTVAGVDEGVEQDGDTGDELVLDEAKRCTRTIWRNA
jgi:hypothetical protein